LAQIRRCVSTLRAGRRPSSSNRIRCRHDTLSRSAACRVESSACTGTMVTAWPFAICPKISRLPAAPTPRLRIHFPEVDLQGRMGAYEDGESKRSARCASLASCGDGILSLATCMTEG
jgi:hypothetical protein